MNEILEQTITVDQIMDYEPCYERLEIEKFRLNFKLPEKMSLEQILNCDQKPEDILWLVLRPEIIPEKILHVLSYRFALDALKAEREAGREPDPGSWRAVEAKRIWVLGWLSDERLEAAAWSAAAAESAAWSAAWSATAAESAAAWSAAAWSATAAESATWSAAAESAAESATWSAARFANYATKSAAWSKQLQIVIEELTR